MTDLLQSKLRILVIDDSEELLDVLSIVLKKNGYDVITKTNTADLKDFLQQTRIDILLMDVVINEINGRDICRELKSDPATSYFPILIMSVHASKLIDFEECLANGVIEKPFDLSELAGKINSSLNKGSGSVNQLNAAAHQGPMDQ